MNPAGRSWFLRLWLTEGIPFAFRYEPAVYEAVRDWLAGRIRVRVKDITLIGSGRIGYSLAPGEYGRSFSPGSDLDFTVVASNLFSTMQDAFDRWKTDVATGRALPNNPQEQTYWSDNLMRLPMNMQHGFVDASKISYRYHELGKIMWELKAKLAATSDNLKVRGASVRIYRDWNSFERQLTLNLRETGRCLN
jgi:hypothetical protein